MARRGKNEGTIFKKPNGSWMAQASIDGRRVSHAARSRAECHDWLRKMLDQIDQGMTFEGRSLTLSAYLREWIAAKKNAVRPKTGYQYGQLISLYLEPGLGKLKLKDISFRVVNRFYERLKDQGIGVSNIQYAHRVLRAALEDAVRSGIIGRNPAHGASVPRVVHKEMQILNDQQVNLFLVAACNSRYRTLYHLAVKTGMRFSELRGLSWADVDWIRGTITVNRQIQDLPGLGSVAGAPKTHSGTRTVLLGDTILNELKAQRVRVEEEAKARPGWQENDLIFPSSKGTPYSKFDVQRDFAKVLQAANLRHIRFHDLRHTAASLMLNHGVPVLVVSKILGHSNPSVTLSIYAHSTLDMQSEAVRIMEEIVNPIPVQMPVLQPTATNCNQLQPVPK